MFCRNRKQVAFVFKRIAADKLVLILVVLFHWQQFRNGCGHCKCNGFQVVCSLGTEQMGRGMNRSGIQQQGGEVTSQILFKDQFGAALHDCHKTHRDLGNQQKKPCCKIHF